VAVAGGVNVITSPNLHQNLAAASFLNPNGSSCAFDASACGYSRGEGAGILVLKPLSKAVAAGDNIIGVISGSAVNQGSNCTSITVPDSHSQSDLYHQALSLAQIDSVEVTYVEAHGTGRWPPVLNGQPG
jgi:acyl transferase domain-containing protein